MLTDNFLRHRSADLSAAQRVLLEGAITRTRVLSAGQVVVRRNEVLDIGTVTDAAMHRQWTRRLASLHAGRAHVTRRRA